MSSWIKISRKILEWEWYDDMPTLKVFIHLLLTANYEPRKWHGIIVERGQLVCSVASLAADCGLTSKQTRRALDNLEATQVVGKRTTNAYTIITICNYDVYQCESSDNNLKEGKQRANKGQTKGQTKGKREDKQRANENDHLTIYGTDGCEQSSEQPGQTEGKRQGKQRASDRATTKEYNIVLSPSLRSVDNTSDGVDGACAHVRGEAIEKLRSEIYNSQLNAERAMMAIGVADKVRYLQMCEEVLAEWSLTAEVDDINWRHLINQLRVKAAAERRQPKTKQSKEEWRQSHMAAAQAALLRIQNRANGIDTDKTS